MSTTHSWNSGPIPMEEIRNAMLGLSKKSKVQQFELQLDSNPALASLAAEVEPDSFVHMLRTIYKKTRLGTKMTREKESPLPPGTELETNEEIERVREELKHRSSQRGNHEPKPATGRLTQPFKPTVRPPAAILIVCDDGEITGEVIRLRSDPFIIGRTEGDFRVPDDEQISSRHVALTRQTVSGQTRWVVTDLQSRNGLFVRVGKSPLSHMSEFLIGSGRYRLEIVQNAGAETAAFADVNHRIAPKTRAFANNMTLGGTLLTEIIASGNGTRTELSSDQISIGSAKDCDICRFNDPFTSEHHASLTRSPKGTWVLQNNNSLNGIWVRMPQIVLEPGKKCEFQIGEQRFRLRYGVSL
jgi:pSer/pThr/pTyr-binding forkhead associated (FHA) protein